MNYAKELASGYINKQRNIETNLKTPFLFPSRTEPTRFLPLGYQEILKITFRLRIAFLEEMTFLFAYCYSKQKFEKIILELEAQGYIESQISKDYGKCWCLSKHALFYIYRNTSAPDSNVKTPEDKLPTVHQGKLFHSKIINGYIAKKVFDRYTALLYQEYKNQDKPFRIRYSKEQYIKHIVYNTQGNYSKSGANAYVESFMPKLEADEQEYQKYRDFIKKLKTDLSDTFIVFNFLKDYYNQIMPDRQVAVENTAMLINEIFTNLYRDKHLSFRETMLDITNNSSHSKAEKEMFLIEEICNILRITKQSLLKTKLDDTPVSAETFKKLSELESFLVKYSGRYDELKDQFTFMLFDKYVNDVPAYKESVINLAILKNLGVYITDVIQQKSGKHKITFGIFQSSCDEMESDFLFTRLEKIFRYASKCLLACDYEIKIFTYTAKHADLIKTKLKAIRETFTELNEYGMALLHFDDMEVISTKQHFLERYEIFRAYK